MPARPTIAAALVLALSLSVGSPTTGRVAAQTEPAVDLPATSRYEPLLPCRLVDTRVGLGAQPIDHHQSRIELDRCGIPDDAVAIVATTTIVGARSNGWLVAFPTGSPRPVAATLNWGAGSTRGNSATIMVGDDRSIDVFRSDGSSSGDVVMDVVGAFVPAATATAGRFVASERAVRLLDTRGPDTPRPTAGTTVRVSLPPEANADAQAAAVTITAIGTDEATFVTAYPAGRVRPTASALNTDAPGQFRTASTIVPVTDDGFDVYVQAGTDLTIDLTGWFTGEAAEESTEGLFVPVAPQRLRDTRPETHPIHPRGTIEIPLPAQLAAGVQDTPPASVAVSMTMVATSEPGFITAHAARAERATTASGYGFPSDITAQFALSRVSDAGLAVYSDRGTDITVDLLGWFTGTPTAMTRPEPAINDIGLPRVLAIGDSTMAGVRWYQALGALSGASWTFLGESCRRLVRWSCNGREDRVPPTAVDAIRSMPASFDVLVMMTGYNDQAYRFADDLERVMTAARQQGIRRVVWLTYSRESRVDKGGPGAFQVFEYHNAILRDAARRHVDLEVAEWSNVVRQRPEWVHYDGIHFTDDGAFANADFMSRAVAHTLGRPCPRPYTDGIEPQAVCRDPGTAGPADVRSIYGFVDTVTQCWEMGPSRTRECVQDPYTV